MRYSEQFHRYKAQFGREPPYPTTGVTCYWIKRRMGTIGERTDIVLSPAACRHFRICAAQPLDRQRAERITAWMARQEAEAIVLGAAERWHKRARQEATDG